MHDFGKRVVGGGGGLTQNFYFELYIRPYVLAGVCHH